MPPPRCARTARAAAVCRSSGSGSSSATRATRRARSSRVTGTTATGSASAAARASRPSKSAVELAHAQTAGGQGEDVGLDLGRIGGGQLDVHRVRAGRRHGAGVGCFYRPLGVRARILGSAAGGGFPQWNCRCPTCEAARTGTAARPRTQSSLAIRGADGPWFLANASPDLRQQLEGLAADARTASRAAPVAGVLLTDAEIDHTAGLLLLRESSTAIRVYGSERSAAP